MTTIASGQINIGNVRAVFAGGVGQFAFSSMHGKGTIGSGATAEVRMSQMYNLTNFTGISASGVNLGMTLEGNGIELNVYYSQPQSSSGVSYTLYVSTDGGQSGSYSNSSGITVDIYSGNRQTVRGWYRGTTYYAYVVMAKSGYTTVVATASYAVPQGTNSFILYYGGVSVKNNGNSVRKNSGTDITWTLYTGSDVYNSGGGRVAFFQNNDSTLSMRHTGFYIYTQTFAPNNFDFAWYIVRNGGTNSYSLYNDFNGGYYITYDGGNY